MNANKTYLNKTCDVPMLDLPCFDDIVAYCYYLDVVDVDYCLFHDCYYYCHDNDTVVGVEEER
jgi:hypothetical protein